MRKPPTATSGSDRHWERPVQTAEVFAPKVLCLEGEYLVWDAERNSKNPPGVGLLDGFLRLADGTPDQILEFARKWGALAINSTPLLKMRSREPVAVWTDLAVRFRALHRIGAEVNAGRVGAAEDWKTLRSEPPASNRSYKALEEARFALMSNMGKLVREARLCPRLYWNKPAKQWQIDFDTFSRTNLLAVLVLKLMMAVADKDGFALCSGCQRSYPPGRQPSVGRRNYCPTCRESGVPFRDSKRELRRRKREKTAKAKTQSG
jgi:hypothetical protein